MNKIDVLRDQYNKLKKNIRFEIAEKEIVRILMNINDFDATDDQSNSFFFDTFVYKVYVYKDKKISVLLTMKDGGSSTEPKRGSDSSLMAEEEGFEPSRPVTSLRAFQARPFSLLGIPPTLINFTIN